MLRSTVLMSTVLKNTTPNAYCVQTVSYAHDLNTNLIIKMNFEIIYVLKLRA